ncbi:hypothetical protein CDAR_618921 [Caerostris darwini]|uniref:Uncharacterized protein n=1 Tax=Caerostris darwini TaxID=1538125 RepID=A0AAV4QYK9_9ARAC|nr:hypothetical protein CDAR_618921 [Caerostris darwini]
MEASWSETFPRRHYFSSHSSRNGVDTPMSKINNQKFYRSPFCSQIYMKLYGHRKDEMELASLNKRRHDSCIIHWHTSNTPFYVMAFNLFNSLTQQPLIFNRPLDSQPAAPYFQGVIKNPMIHILRGVL